MLVRFRRGTAAAWAAKNPVLQAGEAGWTTDSRVLKFGDGVTAWNALPVAAAGGAAAASAGSSPASLGYQFWNMTPLVCNSSSIAAPVAGTLYTQRVPVPVDGTISNLTVEVVTAGVGLTAAGCFAMAYKADGTLLATTADQSGVWNGAGVKDMPLGPFAVAAVDGFFEVALVQNFVTSGARFLAGTGGQPAVNGRLAAAASLFATANTGFVTTPAPATLGAKTPATHSPWVAAW